jgi:hypothetical protein
MLLNEKASVYTELSNQGIKIIPAKIFGSTATSANEQVLVSSPSGQIGMATIGLVHALHQFQFLQLFKGAVNGHQAEVGRQVAGLDENLSRIQRERVARDHLDHRAARAGQAVTRGLKLFVPMVR